MCHLRMVDNQVFTKRRMSSDLIINAPPFLYLRQSLRLAFLFSAPQITLKKRSAECPGSYRPYQNRVKLLREYVYTAGTLFCRELPVSHYPNATDSDSDQEHLQQAFEHYGAMRLIPFS